MRLNKTLPARAMVKKAVMTYSYNASHPQMVSYVKETLIESVINLNKKDEKVFLTIKGSSDYLTAKDLSNFVKYFGDVIKEVFPKMNELKSYLRTIVRICLKLNLPIPRVLPSGAIISQSYLDSKMLKIRPFGFINTKYTFKTIIKDKFDVRKQSNALMPNLIHSLDASSIALLYKELSENNSYDLYTIHDCFAVTADKVELLINLLKAVYLKIYSENLYLITLDKHIKHTIINTFGRDVFTEDNKYIILLDHKEKILYPDINKVIDVNVSSLL